jgi:hypothetical protein
MRFVCAAVATLALIGCSDAPKTVEKKEPPKAAEPVTGRYAFYQMYPSARAWALDAAPLQLKSIQLQAVKAPMGKAGAWQCIFVSPSRNRQKIFTWSAIESEGNLHKGVFGGPDESYTPGRQDRLFLIAALKTDSDEVYQTAAKQSADYIKKNPNKPVNFQLEQTPRFPDLAWRVIWGESVGTSDYSVFVDATTGQLLEKMH